jgi:putative methyltransferase (TIGR04325 family)
MTMARTTSNQAGVDERSRPVSPESSLSMARGHFDQKRRSRASAWLPPELLRLAGALLRRHVRFTGDFASWEAAARGSRGYDDRAILDRVRRATLEVIAGGAVAERDGYLLSYAEPPLPLITAILRVALDVPGPTTIVDFGGGLGGTYRQCRRLLGAARELIWIVVEQEAFAECGRAEFQTEALRFYKDLEQACSEVRPHVVLFSGVLQYLPQPSSVLARAVAAQPDYLVIDRTPFLDAGRHVLTSQCVPRRLGGARYPAWLFDEALLLRNVPAEYEMRHAFDTVDGVLSYGLRGVEFRGFLFERAT